MFDEMQTHTHTHWHTDTFIAVYYSPFFNRISQVYSFKKEKIKKINWYVIEWTIIYANWTSEEKNSIDLRISIRSFCR